MNKDDEALTRLHPEQIDKARASAASAVAQLPTDLGPNDEPTNVFVATPQPSHTVIHRDE